MKIVVVDKNGFPVDLKQEDKTKSWAFVFPGKNLSPSLLSGGMEQVRQKVTASISGVRDRLEYSGFKSDDCLFYGVYYEHPDRQDIVDYNTDEFVDVAVDEFAECLLQARICSDDGHLHKPLQAAAEMGGMMFFGHCYGGMIVSSLERALLQNLRQKGVKETYIEKILEAPKAALTNPMVSVERMPKFFDTFSLVNCSDALFREDESYEKLQEDLLTYSGFRKEQLFVYHENPEQWKYPESNQMTYLKINGAKNLKVLFASSFDPPSRETIDAKVYSELEKEFDVFDLQHMTSEQKEKVTLLQNRLVGGHELRCLIKPLNIKDSEFMQKLLSMYLSEVSAQFFKAERAQKSLNFCMRAMKGKREKEKI